MASRYGKRIVTDGLVLCLDAADNISAPHNDLPVKQGCLMWLDGADDSVFTYSSGTSVSEWRDKSGNNNHVSNSNGTYQPSRNVTINSKSAVNFSDDSLQATNVFSSTATSYTKIAVVYQTSNTAGNVISSNTGHAFWFQSSSYVKLYHNGNFVTSSISLPNNTAGIISGTVQYNSSSSASGEVFVNGASGGTGTTSNASINSTTVQIGSFGGANYFIGYIAEVLVYDRVLSSTELDKVHNYLQNKWNIPVSDGKWTDKTTNGYNGTLVNGLTYADTNKGYFEFDGSSDYIDGPFVSLNPGAFTYESVVYRTSTSFVAAGNGTALGGGTYLQAFLNDSGVAVHLYAPQGLGGGWKYGSTIPNVSNTFVNGNIYHVTIVNINTTFYFYKNGVLLGSFDHGYLASIYNQRLAILRGAVQLVGGTGRVYLCRLYDKALSASQVLQNFNATKGRFGL